MQVIAQLQQEVASLKMQLQATPGNPNLPIAYNYNTYVGARYVPKFADPTEWDATLQYEPLTIVTYLGGSYTSKTFVPPGTLPTNTTFWAPTGNYNAQVELYRQEVLNYTQNTDKNTQDINLIKSNVEANTDNIATITTNLSDNITKTNQNTNDISNINSQLPLLNRRIVFIGDSYTLGAAAPGGAQTTPFPQLIKQNLSLTNDQIYWLGKNGASWKGLNNNPSFTDVITELLPSISNPNTITDIIVAGGANDYVGTLEQGLDGMIVFNNYVKEHFPNAYVHAAFIGGTTDATQRNLYWINGAEIYLRAGFIGFAVIMGAWTVMCNSNNFQPDGVHPNQQGQHELAVMFGNYLGSKRLGGTVIYYHAPLVPIVTVNSNLFASGTFTMVQQLTPYGAYLSSPFSVNIKSGVSIDNGAEILIGKVGQSYISSEYFTTSAITAVGYVTYNTTKISPIIGRLYIKNLNVYIRIIVNDDVISQATRITIESCEGLLPWGTF